MISIIMGGGGTWVFLRIPRENGQILIIKNYFWVFLRNGKIVYYQDVLQLPVPLIKYKYTTHYIYMLSHTTSFKSLTVESVTSSLQCITDTLKAARSEATTMSLF